MTCYMRHMEWLFDELAMTSDKKNRARVDAAIRDVLGLGDEAHCPEVWAAIKTLSAEQRGDLASRVADVIEAS